MNNKASLLKTHLLKAGGLVAVLILVVIAGQYFFRPSAASASSATLATDNAGYVTVVGTVTSIDLSAMPVDGDGIYQVQASDGASYVVHRSSGESNCDRDAIEVSADIRKGTKVEVRGKRDSEIIRLCEPGTHLELSID